MVEWYVGGKTEIGITYSCMFVYHPFYVAFVISLLAFIFFLYRTKCNQIKNKKKIPDQRII